MTGYIAIQRGLLEHPFFADEPFTEREAWIWLIEEAAWKTKRVRIDNRPAVLERGQVAHSLRFMGVAWKWDKNRVWRFLRRLESEGMIKSEQFYCAKNGTPTGQQTGRITICNYDKYQSSRDTVDAQGGTDAGQQRDKEEPLNHSSTTPQGGDLLHPKTLEVERDLERILAISADPLATPLEWCGARMRISAWLSQGWLPEVIISSVRKQAARKQSPPLRVEYYEKGIAEDHARAAAPVPKAKIIPAETFEVKRAEKLRSNNSPADAARRNLERLREGRIRDGTDGPDGR